MRKLSGFAIIALVALPLPAKAQQREQQVYSPYPNMVMVEPAAGNEQVYSDQSYGYVPQEQGVLRAYPGREYYGNRFGPIPRHPGDYRDAVDRGQWTGGSGGGHSFFSLD